MKIGVLYSRVRVEEKQIFQILDQRGIDYDKIDDRQIGFQLEHADHWKQYDVILERSLSYGRGLYAVKILNSWGIPTVNMAHVAETCGDKVATSIVLNQNNIPQPRIRISFTPEAALESIEELGYPVVLKPVVGSWGRLLSRINDRDAAEAILEHKDVLGSYQHSIFYIQEYIQKPGRDIRAFVVGNETICAMYRSSSHWITNTAKGGQGEVCPVTPELNALCVAAANAVGGGVLAVDVLEDPEKGFVVNEVNHTMEFHTLAPVTKMSVSDLIVDYAISVAKGDIQPAFHSGLGFSTSFQNQNIYAAV